MMRWAIWRGDHQLIQKMKNTCDWTLQHSSSWGWVPDGLGSAGSCETCSLTDALHLAALVARHLNPAYYEIVERYARNQLLENQILKPEPFFSPEDSPQKQAVAQALRGSWAAYARPNSLDGHEQKNFEGCCLGSGIRGGCLVWEHILEKRADEIRVNLALSRNSPWLEVIGYQPYRGRLDLIIHDAAKVSVRIPSWVLKNQLQITVQDRTANVNFSPEHYVKLDGLKKGDRVRIIYPLLQEESTEMIMGHNYQARWRGDTLVEIEPKGQIYPLYLRREMESDQVPMISGRPYEKTAGRPVPW